MGRTRQDVLLVMVRTPEVSGVMCQVLKFLFLFLFFFFAAAECDMIDTPVADYQYYSWLQSADSRR